MQCNHCLFLLSLSLSPSLSRTHTHRSLLSFTFISNPNFYQNTYSKKVLLWKLENVFWSTWSEMEVLMQILLKPISKIEPFLFDNLKAFLKTKKLKFHHFYQNIYTFINFKCFKTHRFRIIVLKTHPRGWDIFTLFKVKIYRLSSV